MDVDTVTSYRVARTRADLALGPGEVYLAGGTWLMSEPQPDTTGFVDLAGLGWTELAVSPRGLRIGAMCTIADLRAWAEGRGASPVPETWVAASVVPVAVDALLASFKIWTTATVGGNVCRSFSVASMVSLAVTLDGVAEVWAPDGATRRVPVAEFVTGEGTNVLARGEVLRAVDIPVHALEGRALLRSVALAELGRSGAVVSARLDPDGTSLFAVTSATTRPVVRRYDRMPPPGLLADDIAAAPGYYSDPLGPADWRRGVSVALAERLRAELTA